jgi:hypothetical protein
MRVGINACTILVGTRKYKIPTGRARHWGDNIKMDLKMNKIGVGLVADTWSGTSGRYLEWD